MLFYGVAKVIPTQMPEPPLAASGLWALAGCVPAGWQSWHSHAIWSVTEFIAEGEAAGAVDHRRNPLAADHFR